MENKELEELIEKDFIEEIFRAIKGLESKTRKKISEDIEAEMKEKTLVEALNNQEFVEIIGRLEKLEIIEKSEGFSESKIGMIFEKLKAEQDKEIKKKIFPLANKLKMIFDKEERKIRKEKIFSEKSKKAKSDLQSKLSKLRPESGWKKNLNPYSSDLTSLARLIQTNVKHEPCITFYFDQKKLYYSTNTNLTIELENLEIIRHLKNKEHREFLNLGFRPIIKILSECNEINITIDNEILYRISVLDSVTDLEIKELKDYCQEIVSINKKNSFSSNRVRKSVSNASVHAYDLMRIYKLFSNDNNFIMKSIIESDHEIKIKELKEQVLKLSFVRSNIFTENSENRHVHCECTMCEHIIGEDRELDKGKIETILDAIENKTFTVSKFCCQMCEIIFSSLEENSIRTKLLGNSGILFSNYKSPSFRKSGEFDSIKRRIRTKVRSLKKDCYKKAEEYLENDQKRNEWDLLSMENSDQIIQTS